MIDNMETTAKGSLLPLHLPIVVLLLMNITRAIERRFLESSFVALFVMSKNIPVDHLITN